ncbi:putative cupin superfamily protein [Pseudochelatococcus lubricantis]|uniref:Cupin superfamily protein n=1 Tax=Pseudochelatococcus lubricantis TaxID=1538102 RepID=A0ABX0UX53_9HYPH|nr:cupin domain-containing protein [Pseudochelatococcus lubricantis]NIJ57521.1 putative cupin superfamily protein [Pseudochelatococcus lubricantis]
MQLIRNNTRLDNTTGADYSAWFLNTRITIRLSAADGDDGISIIDHFMPYGESPPLHIHHNEDEIFHVLEGTMRVRIAGEDSILRAGDIAIAPKGVPHSFRVESLSGARCLTICRGHDFETLVARASRPATTAGLPPVTALSDEQIVAFATLCAANHIDLIGGPLD